MFYLISKKDGCNQDILINGLNLKSIEVSTGDKKSWNLVITHQDGEMSEFGFKPEEIFDVSNVLRNIASIHQNKLINPFIVLTDIDNVEEAIDRFGKNSSIPNKVSSILVNIEDIQIAYLDDDDNFILSTNSDNFTVKESPQLIYDLICEKIIPLDFNEANRSVEQKLGIKNRL